MIAEYLSFSVWHISSIIVYSGPSMLLQMAEFHFFSWLNNMPLCVCVCVCVYGLPWWLRRKESAINPGGLNSIPGLGRFPEGGHGNPIQYSCLENPMDRGVWRAAVQGITVIHNSTTKPPLPSPLYESAKWGKEEIHSLFNIQHTCHLAGHVRTDVQAPSWAAEDNVPGDRRLCPQGACSLSEGAETSPEWLRYKAVA